MNRHSCPCTGTVPTDTGLKKYSIPLDADNRPRFPDIVPEDVPIQNLRDLLSSYLKSLWQYSGRSGLPLYTDLGKSPETYIDIAKHSCPTLQNPLDKAVKGSVVFGLAEYFAEHGAVSATIPFEFRKHLATDSRMPPAECPEASTNFRVPSAERPEAFKNSCVPLAEHPEASTNSHGPSAERPEVFTNSRVPPAEHPEASTNPHVPPAEGHEGSIPTTENTDATDLASNGENVVVDRVVIGSPGTTTPTMETQQTKELQPSVPQSPTLDVQSRSVYTPPPTHDTADISAPDVRHLDDIDPPLPPTSNTPISPVEVILPNSDAPDAPALPSMSAPTTQAPISVPSPPLEGPPPAIHKAPAKKGSVKNGKKKDNRFWFYATEPIEGAGGSERVEEALGPRATRSTAASGLNESGRKDDKGAETSDALVRRSTRSTVAAPPSAQQNRKRKNGPEPAIDNDHSQAPAAKRKRGTRTASAKKWSVD
ncbi:hypothetical protein C8R42DRAFT_717672 [Lentinula raphanica]|nr:hypothetical protein C8R42DRAFT_717672 [Lentinula raphanica]